MSKKLRERYPTDPLLDELDRAFDDFEAGGFKDAEKAFSRTTGVLGKLSKNEKEKEAHCYVHLGAIHFKIGHYEDARNLFKKAEIIDPKDDDAGPNLKQMDKKGV